MEKKEKKLSQEEKVFMYLVSHEGITQKDAIREFDCYRLSARIKDLRDAGVNIETILKHDKKTGSHYAFYRLGDNDFYVQG